MFYTSNQIIHSLFHSVEVLPSYSPNVLLDHSGRSLVFYMHTSYAMCLCVCACACVYVCVCESTLPTEEQSTVQESQSEAYRSNLTWDRITVLWLSMNPTLETATALHWKLQPITIHPKYPYIKSRQCTVWCISSQATTKTGHLTRYKVHRAVTFHS